ncbi:MAG: GntR family transcriptional regulator [Oceanospirillaceae bacterium]|nr:GntR family transcriptional regulator [Oceanospirillaceae bacterium]
MSRQNDLFKKTVNQLLHNISLNMSLDDIIENDSAIAKQLEVSRSTARKTIEHLISLKVIIKQDSQRIIACLPTEQMYFDLQDVGPPKEEQVEKYFLDAILSGKIKPGDHFSELELARQSGCNTIAVREFLIRFSRFGLIEKEPRSQWQMKTFDRAFVDQLFEVRHLFEMHALSRFMSLDDHNPQWPKLQQLLDDHRTLKKHLATKFQDFSKLDQRFHDLLQAAYPNQFIHQFYEIISFVFHYHYQWDKGDERERNTVAINEHIEIISHMLLKDLMGATVSLERHLSTAKRSLLNTALYTKSSE